MTARTLVVGVGNLLQRDDGFGPEVARLLDARGDLPPGVRVIETGIAGISLVQALLDGYDALVIVDAVRRGGTPGTLYLLEPDVPDIRAWSDAERHAFLADLHGVEPSRVFGLAAALGVLPPSVRILGCEPEDWDEPAIGLTPAVARAAGLAVERVLHLLDELPVPAACPSARSDDAPRLATGCRPIPKG